MLDTTQYYQHKSISLAYTCSEPRTHTLVFIHGNSACKEVFVHQVNAFKQDYQVIAIDLPGHGESSDSKDPMQDYTIPGYARACVSLLESLMVNQPLLLGWSLGGHIAIEMLGQGLKARGALISGTPPISLGLADFAEAFQDNPVMALTGKQSFTEKDTVIYLDALYSGILTTGYIKAASRTDPIAREAMVTQWSLGNEGVDEKHWVANWDNPIAVIQGEDELFVSLPYLESLSWKNLWCENIIVMPNAGHSPFLQQAEQFNLYLREFAEHCFGTGYGN
jgi:pimeloyl-ACP methyl ester carboxylesterase